MTTVATDFRHHQIALMTPVFGDWVVGGRGCVCVCGGGGLGGGAMGIGQLGWG